MVVTRDPQHAARIKVLGLHGLSKDAWKRFSDEGYRHYEVVEAGFKYNMMDLQAAIGIHQLARVEGNWRRRRDVWAAYQRAFEDLPIERPSEPEPGTRHAHHLYTLLIDETRAGIDRDRFLAAMTRENVGVGVHYLSIPEHPYYQKTFGWRAWDYPHAMRVGRQTVSLPLSAKLTDDDVADVVHAVRAALASVRSRR
jgi:dTDP-4-amino-4,6-dideoxygalactose transaminase